MFKIKGVTVQNYKSIVDTNSVQFKDNISAIVGKTGTGKTSFLKLIQSLRKDIAFQEAELPNGSSIKNQFTNGQVKPNEILMINATFEFDSNETPIINQICNSTNSLEINKFFDGHYEVICNSRKLVENSQDLSEILDGLKFTVNDFKNEFQRIQARININSFKEPTFKALDAFLSMDLHNISEVDLAFQTLQTQLNTLPRDAQLVAEINTLQSLLSDVRNELSRLLENDPVKKIVASLPRITYIDDIFDLEEKVPVDSFIQKVTSSLTFYYLSILSGLTPSGVSKARSTLPQERKSYFDTLSDQLTSKVNEFFDTGYSFKIDLQGQDLLLFVQSRINRNTISVSEMSEGEKWWVAFYLYLASVDSVGRDSIILLDNPATSLHDEGKGEVVRLMNRMVNSNKIQLVYATHEKALIDPWRIDRVILVRKDQAGTNMSDVRGEKRADILESIRKHIGSPAKYSLFGAPRNLFLEGISDVYFVSAFNEYLEAQENISLNKDLYSINAVNGVDETIHFCSLLKNIQLDFVFVIDSNSDKTQRIIKRVGEEVFKRHFIDIREIINQEGDIEDLFSHEIYYELFKLAYKEFLPIVPELKEIFHPGENDKTINSLNHYFSKTGTQLNKVIVAYQTFRLIEQPEITSTDAFQKSKMNFQKLFELIEDKFLSFA